VVGTTAVKKQATSMQGWIMDRNNYYGTNSVFLFDSNNSTHYYLNNKSVFGPANNNDSNSRILKTQKIMQ
jgi:hypothetical protein